MKAKIVRRIPWVYCGARVNKAGQIVDWYGSKTIIVIYDVDEVRGARGDADELRRRYAELRRSVEVNRRLCGTLDCQQWRERVMFEFELDILKGLGVKYEELVFGCGERVPREVEELPEIRPSSILLD